ncbi:biotin transporter BioY [Rathayibacter tanaceti]|uniref:Biotin transporter n=2 Tax=Rathayibacter tanaceti TaxID=1671680 RepID=A0A166D8Q0_9MICO|nr:biotin transporter BioY [Rathayibacter tanaceti]KZX22397.1 Biotin transporter BioY [Rathayibacter tanaceti]QHC55453.1 biotin transporter BioY [Rathayibacter tanaceti]TCO39775.1 biotin transport system substrate-specific component [Rathayibacter tanaceti]
MSSSSSALSRPVLADRLVTRSVASDALLVLAGAGLTAAMAQLFVPMWPVPFTGQTFAVLLVGTTLGALRGALSMVVYALIGALGAPVFTEGSHGWAVLAGPTGGYIVGFVLASLVTGWLAQRRWDRRVVGTLVSFLAGTATIYLVGLPWLAAALGTLGLPADPGSVLSAGLVPFLVGDVLKAVLAAVLLPSTWALLSRRSR